MAEEKLDPRLQKVLDEKKDTPLLEQGIYTALSSKDRKISVVLTMALDGTGLKQEDFDAKQAGLFYQLLVKKITSFKNEDGFFKSTKDTEEMDYPNIAECEELWEMVSDFSSEDKKIKEKASQTYFDRLWKISKLDKEKLTDWEQILVIEQIQDTIIGSMNIALGRDVKKQ